MTRTRFTVLTMVAAGLTSSAWITACGDGAVEPPPPNPPEPATPTTVAVTPATSVLTALGATAQLGAEVRDQNGQAMTGATVSWASGDPSVATVDAAGLVTAAGNGTATVTATAGSASGTAAVTVAQEASTVSVSPAADTLLVGDTLRLSASAVDANGHAVAGAEVAWASGDTLVAVVDQTGLVTALAPGRATVTAAAGEGQGTSEIMVPTAADLDRAALVALYNATDGPNWANSENWLTDAPIEEWYGVSTDGKGRVSRILLSGRWDPDANEFVRHGLSGPIPPELGNLANLWNLQLSINDLTGPIPSELGNLHNLERLYLGHNRLTGPIPAEVSDLANLERLYLTDNRLRGPHPSRTRQPPQHRETIPLRQSPGGPNTPRTRSARQPSRRASSPQRPRGPAAPRTRKPRRSSAPGPPRQPLGGLDTRQLPEARAHTVPMGRQR